MDSDLDLDSDVESQEYDLQSACCQPSGSDCSDRVRTQDLLLFSIPFLGVQITWTIQQVFGLGYLSSLGFADSHLPVLAASGPIAGFLVPPIISPWSDNCRSRWGKRKPFIAAGGLGVIISVLCLSLSQELADSITAGASDTETTARIIAAVSIYGINIFMQPLQLSLRAAVIDHFQPCEQPVANLWISRFSSFGSVVVTVTAFLYDLDFRDICAVSIFALIFLLTISLTLTPHANARFTREKEEIPLGWSPQVSKLAKAWRDLPPITWRVCRAQVLCWFTWFLLLQYTSIFIYRAYASADYKVQSSEIASQSEKAVSRVAVIFQLGAFMATLSVTQLWNPNSRKDIDDEALSPTAATKDHKVLLRTWRICLIVAAFWLLGVFCASKHLDTISLMLGATGVLFSISNWIPYALIAQEISARSQSDDLRSLQIGTVPARNDETVTTLAIHNMSITVPQIAASIVVWAATKGFEIFGSRFDVSWIFLICTPPALLAAWTL